MRSAAREPAEDPVPEQADIDKGLTWILGRLESLVARATPLLTGCPDAQSAPLLRQNIMETVNLQLHVEELRSEVARTAVVHTAVNDAWADGWKACEAAMQQQDIPKAPVSATVTPPEGGPSRRS